MAKKPVQSKEPDEVVKLAWWQVLEAIRLVAQTPDAPFTIDRVLDQVNTPSEIRLPAKDAARWISKFVDWGYLRRGEFEPGPGVFGQRPRRIYHILQKGLEKEFGGVTDLDRLLNAIRDLMDTRGDDGEKEAYQNLVQAYERVIEDRENRFKKKT